jgi:fatty-acyl-CoA synthase
MQADVDHYDLSSVQRVGSGGESLNIDLVTDIRDRVAPDFIQLYAMTESMLSGCALFPEEIDDDTIASVGKPITAVDCRIVDPVERDPAITVDPGETGEILLRGPSIAERVWDDPDRTDVVFHEDGWLFTGDLGHRDDAGFLHIDGRWDNMIISGGINLYPEGVEDAIETHPEVAECAIVGREDDDWGEVLHAYVVSRDDALTAEDLEAWCKASDDLADYARPRSYEFVDDLPRTTSGKLDHAALRSRDPDPDWQD